MYGTCLSSPTSAHTHHRQADQGTGGKEGGLESAGGEDKGGMCGMLACSTLKNHWSPGNAGADGYSVITHCACLGEPMDL